MQPRRCRGLPGQPRGGGRWLTADPDARARGVRAGYESVEVLHGVDLPIEQGSVTAVLGPNGAGKSTLLSVLAGLHPPTDGEVRFEGELVRTGTAHSLVRCGALPDTRG